MNQTEEDRIRQPGGAAQRLIPPDAPLDEELPRRQTKQEKTRERSEPSEGMDDRVIAADLLLSAKTGVKTYAAAITEADTPAVRSLLKRQLDEAIAFQDRISAYMTKQGWTNAYNINQQILIDLNLSQALLDRLDQ